MLLYADQRRKRFQAIFCVSSDFSLLSLHSFFVRSVWISMLLLLLLVMFFLDVMCANGVALSLLIELYEPNYSR